MRNNLYSHLHQAPTIINHNLNISYLVYTDVGCIVNGINDKALYMQGITRRLCIVDT
jgi:hypothetical protein